MHTPLNLEYLESRYKDIERVTKRVGKRGGTFLVIFLFIVLVMVLTAYGLIFLIIRDLPSPRTLRDYKATAVSSHIYDRNGTLLYEIYRNQNRTPITLDELPDYVAKATISIEDKDFYQHSGVSIISGVLRAAHESLRYNKLQGGSTLTQQLVKTALLTPERTLERKFKEMVLAIWAERLYTKGQILEMYLNQVPYGGAAYGVEEAAKTFFDKSAKDLTVDEAALLAGLPQAPSLYSPYINPDAAVRRRNEVLDKMHEQGYINRAQKAKAQNAKLVIHKPETTLRAPHFVFYVKKLLEEQYGAKMLEEGGLRIITTVDLDLQKEVQLILQEELAEIQHLNVSNAAALVTRPPTGEVLAMVGSVDYFASPSGAFNVTTALRQPGSSIKPLNYAVGIDRGLVSAASIFLDVPTCFDAPQKKYCPVNYDSKFHGMVSLRSSLANSYNIPAVKMIEMNGVQEFIASASALTISSFDQPERFGLSLTLGGGEVKMIEMAQAFSSFPNQGIPRELQPVLKITDKHGREVYKFSDPNYVKDIRKPIRYPNYSAIKGERVFRPGTAFIISHILSDNNARIPAFGPSSDLVVPDYTVSVKTGTTDEKRDNWTIGYTPNFLVSVWVGNNDNTPMNQYIASGITGASPMWNRIMVHALGEQPDLKPLQPDDVVGTQVCPNGSLGGNCNGHFEYMLKNVEVAASAPATFKKQVWINKDTGKMAKEGDPNAELQEKTVISDGMSLFCVDCAH